VDVARRVLNQVSDGLEDARRAGRGEIGRLRVSFAASTGLTVLPKIAGNFRKRYPGVELDLREQTTTPQIEALRAGVLDIGLLREPPPERAGFAILEVHREPLIAVVPRLHALSELERIPVTALANEPFVLFPAATGPAFHSKIIEVCAASWFRPCVV
jgi:DNA-binding transcriptional LysR family regulator